MVPMSMGFFMMIIGQVQLDGVHGLVEGPGELVFPERLYHHVLHILQLVGLAAGLGGVGDLRRGRVHWARGAGIPMGATGVTVDILRCSLTGRHGSGSGRPWLPLCSPPRRGIPRLDPARQHLAWAAPAAARLAPLWLAGPSSIIDALEPSIMNLQQVDSLPLAPWEALCHPCLNNVQHMIGP